jgi:hypothetical protein
MGRIDMPRVRLILLLKLCLLATSLPAAAQFGPYEPTAGKPHHNFTLPRIDNGEAVSLSQFRGKKVLLIHFASW